MRHQKILVIGGAGFIGGHLVSALVDAGREVVVSTRRRESGKRLWPLPIVDVVESDISDDATLGRLLRDVDAVINLVGILHGDSGRPYGKAFEAAHVALPRRIVAACRKAGVTRLMHMSALGASSDGPSMYLRSKAAGEAVVEEAGSLADDATAPPFNVTIFRPSVVFGQDDHFLNLFATMQRWLPVIPLAKADATFQPVWVRDVAAAFVSALDDGESFARTYELTGPRVYTLADLVRLSGVLRGGSGGRSRPILPLPDALGRLQAAFLEFAPGPTVMSRDNFDSMRAPSIARGGFPGLVDLGIARAPLEQEASVYLGGKNRRALLDHLRHDADAHSRP